MRNHAFWRLPRRTTWSPSRPFAQVSRPSWDPNPQGSCARGGTTAPIERKAISIRPRMGLLVLDRTSADVDAFDALADGAKQVGGDRTDAAGYAVREKQIGR